MTDTTAVQRGLVALAAAATLVLAGCTSAEQDEAGADGASEPAAVGVAASGSESESSEEASEPTGAYEDASEWERVESDLSSGYEDEPEYLGSEDPEIPSEIPEMVPSSMFPEVEADQLLAYEDFGLSQGAWHLVDPEDGHLGYLNAGQSDFWAPVGGGEDEMLGTVAVERFRPRGARGQMEAVVTFVDQRGEVDGEIVLPRIQYPPHGGDQRAMSSDGRYLYLIDRILNGILVVDTVERELVGELETPGCSYHALLPSGPDTLYVPCWRTGEVLEITVGDGGPEISDRTVAFEEDAQVLYDQLNAYEAGTMTLITRFSEVIPVDLSDGLPTEVAEPVSIAQDGMVAVRNHGRVSADGSTAIIPYAAGTDYEADPERYVVYETATWTATGDLTLPPDVEEVEDLLLSADGSSVQILANEVTLPPEPEPTPEPADPAATPSPTPVAAPAPEATPSPEPIPTASPAASPAAPEEPETGSRVFTVAVPTSEVTGSITLDPTTSGRSFTSLYRPIEVTAAPAGDASEGEGEDDESEASASEGGASEASGTPSAGGGAAEPTDTVAMTEFAIDPVHAEVAAGDVLAVTNEGALAHDYRFRDEDGEVVGGTSVIGAGDEGELEVDVPAGTYEVFCAVPGHEDAGMVGELTVTR